MTLQRMKNEPVSAAGTKRYQTRRKQEIKNRELAKHRREADKKSTAAELARTSEPRDPNEYVVPIEEAGRITRYWRESDVRKEWNALYKRTGWPKAELEQFIAARRRPPIQRPITPTPPLKSPGWYLGFGSTLE